MGKGEGLNGFDIVPTGLRIGHGDLPTIGLHRSAKVDQVDVFVFRPDPFKLDPLGSDELLGFVDRQSPVARELYPNPRLLEGLAYGGLVREFVWFDVSTYGEPLAELLVVMKEDAVAPDDENCNCEVPRGPHLQEAITRGIDSKRLPMTLP